MRAIELRAELIIRNPLRLPNVLGMSGGQDRSG